MTSQQTTSSDEQPIDIGVMYDIVMEAIEKDLLRKNLPLLEEKYKGESEEKRLKRLAHYQECLEIFDEAMEDIAQDAALHAVLKESAIPLEDPFALALTA